MSGSSPDPAYTLPRASDPRPAIGGPFSVRLSAGLSSGYQWPLSVPAIGRPGVRLPGPWHPAAGGSIRPAIGSPNRLAIEGLGVRLSVPSRPLSVALSVRLSGQGAGHPRTPAPPATVPAHPPTSAIPAYLPAAPAHPPILARHLPKTAGGSSSIPPIPPILLIPSIPSILARHLAKMAGGSSSISSSACPAHVRPAGTRAPSDASAAAAPPAPTRCGSAARAAPAASPCPTRRADRARPDAPGHAPPAPDPRTPHERPWSAPTPQPPAHPPEQSPPPAPRRQNQRRSRIQQPATRQLQYRSRTPQQLRIQRHPRRVEPHMQPVQPRSRPAEVKPKKNHQHRDKDDRPRVLRQHQPQRHRRSHSPHTRHRQCVH